MLKKQYKVKTISKKEYEWTNKEKIHDIPDLPLENKITADDMNYLKTNAVDNRWIIGELKWVWPGTEMPAGWEPVDIAEGLTLVNSNGATGITNGKNNYTQRMDVKYAYPKNGNPDYILLGQQNGGSGAIIAAGGRDGEWSGIQFNTRGQEYKNINFAGGLYAELWKYTGLTENKIKRK